MIDKIEFIDVKRDKKLSLDLKPIDSVDFIKIQDFFESNRLEVHVENYTSGDVVKYIDVFKDIDIFKAVELVKTKFVNVYNEVMLVRTYEDYLKLFESEIIEEERLTEEEWTILKRVFVIEFI